MVTISSATVQLYVDYRADDDARRFTPSLQSAISSADWEYLRTMLIYIQEINVSRQLQNADDPVFDAFAHVFENRTDIDKLIALSEHVKFVWGY